MDDPRKSINLIAVRNLLTLARNVPHLWTSDHVDVGSIVSKQHHCIPTSGLKNFFFPPSDKMTNVLAFTVGHDQ